MDSSNHRCTGAPSTGWGELGGYGTVSLEVCREACLARTSCKFAVYNSKVRKCSEFRSCNIQQYQAGVVWRVFEKVAGDGGGGNEPVPKPTPPPTPPPSGKCCRQACRRGECANNLFCCPNWHMCMDDSTGSTQGPNCDRCSNDDDDSGGDDDDSGGGGDSDSAADDSCEYALDGECDEDSGHSRKGTDCTDCNSCDEGGGGGGNGKDT